MVSVIANDFVPVASEEEDCESCQCNQLMVYSFFKKISFLSGAAALVDATMMACLTRMHV